MAGLQFLAGPTFGFLLTAVFSLVALKSWRDKKQADISQATSTWREIAESRGAKITVLEDKEKRLIEMVARFQFRLDFLWNAIEVRARRPLNRQMKVEEDSRDFEPKEDEVS